MSVILVHNIPRKFGTSKVRWLHLSGFSVNIACTTGDLYFAYLTVDDTSEGENVYKSVVNNPYLDQSQGTSYARIIVKPGKDAYTVF